MSSGRSTTVAPVASDAVETHDFVIIGAGSAGCIVAAELAADLDQQILVLEGGPPADENPETLSAVDYPSALSNPELLWERFSVPQAGCNGLRFFCGTGRGVGGSGAVNSMVYTRGAAFDFDDWGVPGWRWSDVIPDFEELESRLNIQRMPPTRFTEACIASALSSGLRRKASLDDGDLAGYLGYNRLNLAGAERRSSYVAFLRPREHQANLTLRTRAQVRTLLISKERRVYGVEYLHEGRLRRAIARREVVLCAGAVESPRLLKLSGVGPGDELQRHGIGVHSALRGVGQNLMDHPNVSLFYLGKQSTDCHWAQLYGYYHASPDGPSADGQANMCFMFYSARSSLREGMMQVLPAKVLPRALYQRGWAKNALRSAIANAFQVPSICRMVDRCYGIVVILGKPQSRGSITLVSADPEVPAAVDPAYFTDSRDLRLMLQGIRHARHMASSPALGRWGNHELRPGGAMQDTTTLAEFIKGNAMTSYHFAGTCQMGEGANSVVDARLRVRGVAGLRVADASVMPHIPVTPLNAASMLIGYRAARYLREDG